MSLKFLETKLKEIEKQNKAFGKWEEAFGEKINKGSLFSLMIFEKLHRTPINWAKLHILTAINTSTYSKTTQEQCDELFNEYVTNGKFKSFKKEKVGYSFVFNNGSSFRLVKITDFFPGIEKDCPELLTTERHGHCHLDSFCLSNGITLPHKLVSGFCSGQSDKMKFPHTWIEIESKTESWVLDFTLNAAISKDLFYALYKPENLVIIDSEQVKKDNILIRDSSFNGKDIRMYLFYPDETREVIKSERENLNKSETEKSSDFPRIGNL